MRAALLALLLLVAPADAAPDIRPAPEFKVQLAAAVFSTAFGFIQSRSIEVATVEQIALWGLRAVTALDPGLEVERRDGILHLNRGGSSVHQRGAPASDAPGEWGAVAADMTSAAWDASANVRGAGTQGVITAVFEEVFNFLDPYSRYVPPFIASSDRMRRSGDAGAGLEIMQAGGAFVVKTVNADGPGAEAGIVPGDRVLAVDGQPVRGVDLETLLELIAGVEGTDVTLTLRGRRGGTRIVTVERAVVPPETVFTQRYGDILLIRVTGFSADTDQRLSNELERMLAPPARVRGLVLDLRGNRGGLLRQAVAATDLVLASGIVARTEGRNPRANNEFRATAGDMAAGRPMIVLVDGQSASAAEIMAAALADGGRAVVVGSATLGKGLVQTIATLPDGGELFVSWSRILAPRGWPIQGLGVLPQVCTSLGSDSVSQQIASLNRGISRFAAVLARHRAARAPVSTAETVDLRAACPAADGRDSDLAAARTLLNNPTAYTAALMSADP